jgi:hypothetical protein
MASAGIPKVTLKPIVARLDAMERRARKARESTTFKAEKQLFGVRVNKLRRAKKCLKAFCKAFNI